MLSVQNLSKFFQGTPILKNLSFQFEMGTIVALLGPSGSGKSTLLRCLSRLERIDEGTMTFQSHPLAQLPSHAIGMVFQGFHLFPHMTVLQNLMHAPLRVQKISQNLLQEKAMNLLEQFGLSHKTHQFPNQLSGGQKQRIAIARALMMEPPILLFDEPTSALDPEMTSEVATLIQNLQSPERLIIMATHELRVARLAADQVLFLDQGSLMENLPTARFFEKPETPRAQEFLKNFMI